MSAVTTILVTGAGRGIGAAVARLGAEKGHAVALVDRDSVALGKTTAALRKIGVPVVSIVCDVSSESDTDSAFDTAERELGAVTGVVAAAGIDRGGLAHELSSATWDEVIAVNLRGTFLTCRAAIRQMLGIGGSIVCVSSPFALASPPVGAAAYSASKSGICALVRSLAVDYGGRGIRVNAILPGPTETELMWANVPEARRPETRRTLEAEIPLGRLADPDEPAKAALWLLSDEASYVTGSQIACDGGVLAKASVSV